MTWHSPATSCFLDCLFLSFSGPVSLIVSAAFGLGKLPLSLQFNQLPPQCPQHWIFVPATSIFLLSVPGADLSPLRLHIPQIKPPSHLSKLTPCLRPSFSSTLTPWVGFIHFWNPLQGFVSVPSVQKDSFPFLLPYPQEPLSPTPLPQSNTVATNPKHINIHWNETRLKFWVLSQPNPSTGLHWLHKAGNHQTWQYYLKAFPLTQKTISIHTGRPLLSSICVLSRAFLQNPSNSPSHNQICWVTQNSCSDRILCFWPWGRAQVNFLF